MRLDALEDDRQRIRRRERREDMAPLPARPAGEAEPDATRVVADDDAARIALRGHPQEGPPVDRCSGVVEEHPAIDRALAAFPAEEREDRGPDEELEGDEGRD